MSSSDAAVSHDILIEHVRSPGSWHSYRIATASFPLSPEARVRLAHFVVNLVGAAARIFTLQPTLWLDCAHIHEDGANRLLSSHARKWSPSFGFCFDPTGPAPRTLQFSDLADAEYGTPPTMYDRGAILVSSQSDTMRAYDIMCGRGLATMIFFTSDGLATTTERFMGNSRKTLEPLVASSSFKHHTFYLPLLSSSMLSRASSQDLHDWLDDSALYVREVHEEKELFLLAPRDPAPVFEAMNLKLISANKENKTWLATLPHISQDERTIDE